jgi:hypothetical protein
MTDAPERMCVNCGRTRPASEGRDAPGKDCPSPDACTWDMTPEEAADHWRKLAHNRAAEIARLREALLALADEYADPTLESEGPAYRAARAALGDSNG